jgi:hypothetical protein
MPKVTKFPSFAKSTAFAAAAASDASKRPSYSASYAVDVSTHSRVAAGASEIDEHISVIFEPQFGSIREHLAIIRKTIPLELIAAGLEVSK